MFFFSKYDYQSIKNEYGLDNVYYLPLAVNTERLDKIMPMPEYESDVALVGGLYNSDSFLGLKSIMSKEQQLYLDAVIAVQMKYSGSVVVDEALTRDFIEGVCEYYRSHVTHMDRVGLLRLCAGKGFHTRLYLSPLSKQNRELLESHNVELCDCVNYENEMPAVFKSAKINLNPTLRANRTGIPLRVVDVLGSGGFLLTTHQAELDEFFNTDEIVYYENIEEALDKVQYYMAHEEERIKIARSGYERIKKDFSFPDRIAKMFSTI